MEDFLYGRLVQLNDLMPENVVRMHPKTWEKIKPIHRNGEVDAEVSSQSKDEGLNGRMPRFL